MAFKLITRGEVPPFKASARFPVGGKTEVIKLTCRHLGQTSFSDWAGRECSAIAPAREMAQHAAEVIESWDVVDESDNAVPVSVDALSELIEHIPAAYVGIVQGYVRGRVTALEGN